MPLLRSALERLQTPVFEREPRSRGPMAGDVPGCIPAVAASAAKPESMFSDKRGAAIPIHRREPFGTDSVLGAGSLRWQRMEGPAAIVPR